MKKKSTRKLFFKRIFYLPQIAIENQFTIYNKQNKNRSNIFPKLREERITILFFFVSDQFRKLLFLWFKVKKVVIFCFLTKTKLLFLILEQKSICYFEIGTRSGTRFYGPCALESTIIPSAHRGMGLGGFNQNKFNKKFVYSDKIFF